jgi:hypothetical protein
MAKTIPITFSIEQTNLRPEDLEQLTLLFENSARKLKDILRAHGMPESEDITIHIGTNAGDIEAVKNVTPSTSKQTITPSSGYQGIAKVVVAKVTAAIDENIVAGNIKSGVTILGVTGSYEGGPDSASLPTS